MSKNAILSLVERFENHKAEYTSGVYNETQLRRDFLDPFFEALGWDVFNQKGWSEAFREVIQGSVYERFLGKTIRLTTDHRAFEKPFVLASSLFNI